MPRHVPMAVPGTCSVVSDNVILTVLSDVNSLIHQHFGAMVRGLAKDDTSLVYSEALLAHALNVCMIRWQGYRCE